MKKPVIGISSGFDTFCEGVFRHANRVFVVSNYVESVIRAGAVPLVIPSCEMGTDNAYVCELINLCDGVILTGGNDIDPIYYSEEPHPLLLDMSREKDRLEYEMAKRAYESGKGILGICKGMQFLNVFLGGTLYQDISLMQKDTIKHRQGGSLAAASHSIEIVEGSFLYGIYGAKGRVNSAHHQAIKDIAPELKAVAFAPDGIIEAVCHKERENVLGTQFHPEMMSFSCEKSQNIFNFFVKAII